MIDCPACGIDSTVLETRRTKSYARRRRVCKNTACGQKFTTMEFITRDNLRVDDSDLLIIKRSDLERLFQYAGQLLATSTTAGEKT